jgi:hypothetical protein
VHLIVVTIFVVARESAWSIQQIIINNKVCGIITEDVGEAEGEVVAEVGAEGEDLVGGQVSVF